MAGFWQSTWDLVRARRRLADDPGVSASRADLLGVRLLMQNLSQVQRQQFLRHGYFDVIGSDTGARYRIRTGRSLNVAQLNTSGGCVCLLCFEPHGVLPSGDVMLAQKIALELFESEAISVANVAPTLESGRRIRCRHR